MDELAPDDSPPPRQVEAWTRVTGHVVAAKETRTPFCSCGDRAPKDWAASVTAWREKHLAEAWPILVPRLDGERLEDWLARITDAWAEAVRRENELAVRDGLTKPVGEGQPYPVMSQEYLAATSRAEVLEHQRNEVAAKLGWPHP